MAKEHEQWVLELFSGLDIKTVRQLHSQLGQLRTHLPIDGDTPAQEPAK